jgi:hypothetical protein
MSLIMGTENLLVGREGEGSRALSEDKSRNLYMNVNSTLGEMAQSHNRDTVGAICALNGIPDELRPELVCEDASFKDVQQIASTLKDMATAGAVLAPDDPAIDDVRDLLGLEKSKPMSPDLRGMVAPKPGGKGKETGTGSQTNDPTTTRDRRGKIVLLARPFHLLRGTQREAEAMADVKRDGDLITIGDRVRIEAGPALVHSTATAELLSDAATASHYAVGQRDALAARSRLASPSPISITAAMRPRESASSTSLSWSISPSRSAPRRARRRPTNSAGSSAAPARPRTARFPLASRSRGNQP